MPAYSAIFFDASRLLLQVVIVFFFTLCVSRVAFAESVSYQYDTFQCRYFNIILKPFGGCVRKVSPPAAPLSVPVSQSVPVTDAAQTEPASEITVSETTPATDIADTVIRPVTNTYVTNNYITNPVEIIRQFVTGSTTSATDANSFVSEALFYKQVEKLNDTISDRNDDTADASTDAFAGLALLLETDTLSVSGNGTIAGTLSVAGGTTLSSNLLLAGTGANIILGTNYLSGDGDDEGVYVAGDGSVGIGTTTPPERLSIENGALFLGNYLPSVTSNRLYAQSGGLYWGSTLLAGGAVGTWDSNGSGVYRLTGSVGIGTSSPTKTLHVFTGASGALGTVSQDGMRIEGIGPTGLDITTSDANSGRLNFGSPANSRNAAIWGFNNAGDSTLSLRTNNVERLRINSVGNVGIGTTSPTATLAITGSGATNPFTIASSSGASLLTVLANGNVGIGVTVPSTKLHILSSDPTLYSSGLMAQSPSDVMTLTNGDQTTTGYTGLMFQHKTSNVAIARIALTGSFFDSDIAALTFGLRAMSGAGGARERMRITAEGNVGIGTTSPTATLSITGNGAANPFTIASSSGASLLTVLANGNVGIGTTSPTNNLIVATVGKADSDTLFRVTEDERNVFQVTSRDGVAIDLGVSRFLNINYDGVLSIGVGNLSGVPAITAADHLGLQLRAREDDPGAPYGLLFANDVDMPAGVPLAIWRANTTDMMILSDVGNLGIGATSTNKLTVGGAGYFAGNLTATGTLSISGASTLSSLLSLGGTAANIALGSNYLSGDGDDEGIFVSATGNVGIGTTSPTSKLFVDDGQIAVQKSYYASGLLIQHGGTASAGLPAISIIQSTGGAAGLAATFISRGASDNGAVIGYGTTGVSPSASTPEWYAGLYGNIGIGTGYNYSIYESTGGSSLGASGNGQTGRVRLIILPGGNVGIGSSTPTSLLTIASSTAAGTSKLFTVATTSDIFTILANGNVGIGTTSPTSKLTVSDDTSHAPMLLNDGAYTYGFGYGATGNTINIGANSGAPFVRWQSGQRFYFTDGVEILTLNGGTDSVGIGDITPEAMLEVSANGGARDLLMLSYDDDNDGNQFIVKNSGRVGIGTTSPAAKLTVVGTTGSTSNLFSVASSSGEEYLVIGSTGNIGIGTTTLSSELTVDGTILASNLLGGATTLSTDANGNIIRTPSDERLKTNVTEIDNALETILGLRGVRYEWLDKERFGAMTEVGFLAQEVDPLIPEVVRKGGEYWTLNTPNMLAYVVEAIKEMWRTIQGHTDKIEQLESENEILKSRLDEIDNCLRGGGNCAAGNFTPQKSPTPETPSNPTPSPAPTDDLPTDQSSSPGTDDENTLSTPSPTEPEPPTQPVNEESGGGDVSVP